jgi:hypothetical protein
MNGKQAKEIRRKAKQSMMQWFKDMLPEEERGEVTVEKVMEQIPQGYHKSMGTTRHSAYSMEWFIKAEKLKYYYG